MFDLIISVRVAAGILFAVALIAIPVHGRAVADPTTYTFTTIDDPGATYTDPTGINDNGEIIGQSSIGGFLYNNGNLTPLQDPNAAAGDTFPNGINNSGAIVGSYETQGPGGGFIYNSTTNTWTTAGSSPLFGTPLIPTAINNNGQITGQGYDFTAQSNPYYVETDGTFAPAPFFASGINDLGQLVGGLGLAGNLADLNGSVSTLTAPGSANTYLAAINDSGTIVGFDNTSANPLYQGLIYNSATGQYTTLNYPGAVETLLTGINNSGQIVGEYVAPQDPIPQGFLATPGAPSCAAILQNAVQTPTLSAPSLNGGNTVISTTFTPNFGLTLATAASDCSQSLGVALEGFDWEQTVLDLPSPSPFFQNNNFTPLTANPNADPPTTFNDPPLGGYNFVDACDPTNVWSLSFPFYYNPTPSSGCASVAAHRTTNTLSFKDSPADNCLPPLPPFNGGTGANCDGETAPPGSELEFLTQLVGIRPNDTAIPLASLLLDPSLEFTWTDTFNGVTEQPGTGTGGIDPIALEDFASADPSTGTGGIVVISPENTPVPEPSSLFILTSGIVVFITFGMKKGRRRNFA